jgi:hypothetical protein
MTTETRKPSTIRPTATRDEFVAAVRATERLKDVIARTGDDELVRAAFTVNREAWLALERFDAR